MLDSVGRRLVRGQYDVVCPSMGVNLLAIHPERDPRTLIGLVKMPVGKGLGGTALG